jgi:hypothetical protein
MLRYHYTCPVITQTAKQIARSTKNNTVLRVLARVGFAVNGLIHILIGGIAVGIATGTATADADEAGALSQLASSPGAAVILWTIVIGLFALGIWLALTAFLHTDADPKRKWAHSVADLGKAIAYFIVAGTAVPFALGTATSSDGGASTASAKLLATPGGVFVLVAAGIGVVAIGCYFIYKGIARKFTSDIVVPHGTIGQATVALGVTGYVAKGVAIGVVGILLVVAAFTLDASKAEGLDGSLKALLGLPFGVAILCVVGAGLVAYGVYCFARARRARLQ